MLNNRGQNLGEDIRAAKAIYEYVHGEQDVIDVNAWLRFGKEAMNYFGLPSIYETARKLELPLKFFFSEKTY